jgi:hypothetical protein
MDNEQDPQNLQAAIKETIQTKDYEIQDLKEQVRDLEESYSNIVADYNYLLKTRNHENDIYKEQLSQKNNTINELSDKLAKVEQYVRASELFDMLSQQRGEDRQSQTNELISILHPNIASDAKSPIGDKEKLEQQLSQITEKIPVKEITIVRLEGPSVECDIEHKAYSFEEANKIIKEMSKSAPNEKEGGYDKVRFSVEFSDNIANKSENIYTGRIDMMHYSVASNAREQNIPQHIHDHLSFYNGTLKPDHMSQQSYDDFLSKNTTKQSKQEIKEFLEKYIPDEAKHPKVVAYKLEQLKADAKSNELSNAQSATKTTSSSREKDGGLGY